jgi:hypothetical protein
MTIVIMSGNSKKGKRVSDADIRKLFSRTYLTPTDKLLDAVTPLGENWMYKSCRPKGVEHDGALIYSTFKKSDAQIVDGHYCPHSGVDKADCQNYECPFNPQNERLIYHENRERESSTFWNRLRVGSKAAIF